MQQLHLQGLQELVLHQSQSLLLNYKPLETLSGSQLKINLIEILVQLGFQIHILDFKALYKSSI